MLMGAGIYSNVVRILVPLVVTNEDLQAGLDILDGCFAEALITAGGGGGPGHRRPAGARRASPGQPVRLAAGPAAFPAAVLDAVEARTGCSVQIVPPLAPERLARTRRRPGRAGGGRRRDR